MTTADLVRFTRRASLLCGGTLAGVAVTVLFLELALRRVDGPEYVRVRQAEFDYFTWFIGAIFTSTIVAVVVLVVHARRTHSPTLRPAVVALVLLLLSLVITLVINGPINVEQLGWNAQAPPPDWASVRDRWQIAHAVRTVAIVIGLGYLGAAVMTGKDPRQSPD
jgi:uncharacterized membrane protein